MIETDALLVVSMPTVADFFAWVKSYNLLEPGQVDDLARDLEGKYEDPRPLADELVERGLLTPFQVNELLRGHGSDLVIGPYRILHPLGEGAMGQVFKARHRRLQRIVAIKIIRRERMDAELIRRFHREAQVAAQLSHPNVVLIYDADQHEETHFIAMEHVEGIDLARLLRERGRPLPVPMACDYMRQAALGLQHAFERGMVHRDIKPSNMLVTRFIEMPAGGEDDFSVLSEDSHPLGLVKILDMGLARLNEGGDKAASFLTQVGTVIGTPDFIAPEQARNSSKVDIRADLYSLGCTFYYLLAGRPPFPEGSVVEKLLMHQLDEPAPVEEYCPTASQAVSGILRKLMAKRPDDRFQTPRELADALQALHTGNVSLPSPADSQESEGTAILSITPTPPKPATADSTPVHRQPIIPSALVKAPSEESVPALPPREQMLTPPPAAIRDMDTPVPSGELTGETQRPPNLSTSQDSDSKGDPGQQAKRITTLSGHTGWVVSLAFSPDRNRLVSGGVDGNVWVWGFSSKVAPELQLPKVHDGEVHAVAFAPDSNMLASASGTLDGQVFVWNLEGGEPRRKACFDTHTSAVETLAFSPSGKLLASGGYDKIVYLWDVANFDPGRRYTLKGHRHVVSSVAFAPGSKIVASGDQGGFIHLWSVGKIWASEQTVLQGHNGVVRRLVFSANGRYLASASQDETIRLWDLEANTCRILQGMPDVVSALLFLPDGNTLASVSLRGQVLLWDLESATALREWTLRSVASSYDFTHDGRYLAAGRGDGKIEVYRLYPRRQKSD